MRRWPRNVTLLLLLVGMNAAADAQAPRVTIEYIGGAAPAFGPADRARVDSIAHATTTEVRMLLPGVPSEWTLRIATGPGVIPETGEAGFALSPTQINWTVNPKADGGVERIVRERLRKVLFHELHHLARGWTSEGGTPPTSVLDAAVSEGMATAFARDFAGDAAPWGAAPAEVQAWACELAALPSAALLQYGVWMFQHPDGRRWIGYRTGTWIVDRAMQQSGGTSITLVRRSAQEVLRSAAVLAQCPAPAAR